LLATLSQPELRRDDASLPLSSHDVVYVGLRRGRRLPRTYNTHTGSSEGI
jgi:hypothetical protein